MSMSEPIKSGFFYLKYVKLGQAYSEVKETIWLWLIGSIFFLVLGGLGVLGTESLGIGDLGKTIPQGAWYFGFVAIFTWLLRGEHIGFDMPKFTFWQWLLFNLFVLAVAGIGYVSPWWVLTPLYLGFMAFAGCYETLVAIGKENYETES